MDASAWAAWVQAIGSILAIGAGFGSVIYQNHYTTKREAVDRRSRAEVVALRLSVWLGEIGGRIDTSLLRLEHFKATRLPVDEAAPQLKLGAVGQVDAVMSDLHYLTAGAGDVAQLDTFARFFNAFVENQAAAFTQAFKAKRFADAPGMGEFYASVENQLRNMKQLHTNAERHLSPLIDGAVGKER